MIQVDVVMQKVFRTGGLLMALLAVSGCAAGGATMLGIGGFLLHCRRCRSGQRGARQLVEVCRKVAYLGAAGWRDSSPPRRRRQGAAHLTGARPAPTMIGQDPLGVATGLRSNPSNLIRITPA